MNFDFILHDDQESLRRKLVYYHTQTPASQMWSIKQYRIVIGLLKQRNDAHEEFVKDWILALRPYSLYD